MADDYKPQQGDEAELFERYNDQLMRRLARVVRTSPDVIEDACSIAWAQFLRHQPDRDREWRAWLFRTAQREAWLLDRKRRETRTFEADSDDRSWIAEPADRRDAFTERDELEAAVDVLAQLPPGLRRIAFLAPWLADRPVTDPDVRFVAPLCLYHRQVLTRALPECNDPEIAGRCATLALGNQPERSA